MATARELVDIMDASFEEYREHLRRIGEPERLNQYYHLPELMLAKSLLECAEAIRNA